MTDITAPTVEGRLSPTGRQIVISCPYCGKQHFHGAGGGDRHRAAHCDQQRYPQSRPGYIIKMAISPIAAWGEQPNRSCRHPADRLQGASFDRPFHLPWFPSNRHD